MNIHVHLFIKDVYIHMYLHIHMYLGLSTNNLPQAPRAQVVDHCGLQYPKRVHRSLIRRLGSQENEGSAGLKVGAKQNCTGCGRRAWMGGTCSSGSVRSSCPVQRIRGASRFRAWFWVLGWLWVLGKLPHRNVFRAEGAWFRCKDLNRTVTYSSQGILSPSLAWPHYAEHSWQLTCSLP